MEDLSSNNAVDSYGNAIDDESIIKKGYKIFNGLDSTSGTAIEDTESDFNAHKLQVIRNSIETNLNVAITNFNKYSKVGGALSMPKLSDEEWEKVTSNVTMISFLQGMNIGGKLYNGYSIVPNSSTDDYVSEDSIYIITNDNSNYHRVTDNDLIKESLDTASGVLNIDFQRRTATVNTKKSETEETGVLYYYPKQNLGCYNCIINPNNTNSVGEYNSIYEYLYKGSTEGTTEEKQKYQQLATIYYTALGRERQGMYRVSN